MDNALERKIEVTRWIIKARWFYLFGIVMIGVFARILGQYNMSGRFLVFIFLVSAIFNFSLQVASKKFANSHRAAKFVDFAQVIYEVVVFIFVFYYAGAIESVTGIFLVIPILSSSLIFGPRGSMISAFISGIAVSAIVVMEFKGIIPHLYRYGISDVPAYDYPLIAVTQVLSLCLFYLVVGAFSGFSSRLLFRRETAVQEKTVELSRLNNALDGKIAALEQSEKKTKSAYDNLKKLEAELFEEHERNDSLIMSMVDPVIMLDKDQKIRLINQSARIVLGIKHSDIGSWVSSRANFSLDNFKKFIRRRAVITTAKQLDSGERGEELIEIQGREHNLFFKVLTVPINNQKGEYIGVLKIFYNITREKGLELMKSEFITVAAHQLRTPLSAVKWAIKMVMDNDEKNLTEEQLGFLDRGYKSNERVIKLVNDMLNVSRIEEGRFGFKFREEHIEVLLSFILDNLKNRFIESKIALRAEIPAGLPKLNIDREKLGLALENLLDNAIRYTPAGGEVVLSVEAGKTLLKISIKDSGIGIPTDGQRNIFGRFYRGANALKVQTEGSGLGLFIVKNIIDNHQGKISFTSEEGKGTEFVVTLPIDIKPIASRQAGEV